MYVIHSQRILYIPYCANQVITYVHCYDQSRPFIIHDIHMILFKSFPWAFMLGSLVNFIKENAKTISSLLVASGQLQPVTSIPVPVVLWAPC